LIGAKQHAVRRRNRSNYGSLMSRLTMIWGGAVSGTSLTPKNTAGINIFAANTSFRRKPAKRGRKIDENRSLAYKPRKLSAGKFRLCRGRLQGAEPARLGISHRRTRYQSNRQICPRSAENDP
jgi:hypothetical protein